jgi:uncharacterized protein (TIGR02145 family)
MKRFITLQIIVLAIFNLTSQNYIDVNFAGTNGVLPQTIQVTNLTKGTSVNLQGTDVLRLNFITTALNEVSHKESGLLVYPNPIKNNGYFSIDNKIPGKVEVQLNDLNGKTLYKNSYNLSTGEHMFSISGVPDGVHLLTIILPTSILSERITSSGSSEVLVTIDLLENRNFVKQNNPIAFSKKINQNSEIVELNYNSGDKLLFSASAAGYVSQGFYLSPVGNQTITFTFQTQIQTVYNPVTGEIWMDRNLGASRVATSSKDMESYGDLYQWGRNTDGHEKRTSFKTSALSNNDLTGHGNFVVLSSGYNWRNPQNDNLWQGLNGTNNPCPEGFRIPTSAEWEAERNSWSSNNSTGAYSSPLKLTVAGVRFASDGNIDNSNFSGMYWSSTLSGSFVQCLSFFSSYASISNGVRSGGCSVRCIKD